MSNRSINIVKDSIRRFSHLGDRTISRYILSTYGDLFEQDIEKIRDRVRYWRGKKGKKDLATLKDKSFVVPLNTKMSMPESWNPKVYDYHLKPGLWLVLSDLHVPFHEVKPLEAAIQAGQAENA